MASPWSNSSTDLEQTLGLRRHHHELHLPSLSPTQTSTRQGQKHPHAPLLPHTMCHNPQPTDGNAFRLRQRGREGEGKGGGGRDRWEWRKGREPTEGGAQREGSGGANLLCRHFHERLLVLFPERAVSVHECPTEPLDFALTVSGKAAVSSGKGRSYVEGKDT